MIHPVPPFGFIPVMLLKQDPWVAREVARRVLSQHLLLLLYQTLGRGVKFWGSPRALQPPPLAAPCASGTLCSH